jgi:hypothetical protein
MKKPGLRVADDVVVGSSETTISIRIKHARFNGIPPEIERVISV